MPRTECFNFDGLNVPLSVWGRRKRQLIFLPGLGVHPSYYAEGLGRLARHLTVIVPDLSFRSNAKLPEAVWLYQQVADALGTRYAPGASVAGHSFGGFVALLGPRPAVALSPTVPVRVGWPGKLMRAFLMQLREYSGLEGPSGPSWAWNILRDYARTVMRRPRCLFPPVAQTLRGSPYLFTPATPRAHVVVARRDQLYRLSEIELFLSPMAPERVVVRCVDHGHSWPVTHPELFEREILRSLPDRPTEQGVC